MSDDVLRALLLPLGAFLLYAFIRALASIIQGGIDHLKGKRRG